MYTDFLNKRNPNGRLRKKSSGKAKPMPNYNPNQNPMSQAMPMPNFNPTQNPMGQAMPMPNFNPTSNPMAQAMPMPNVSRNSPPGASGLPNFQGAPRMQTMSPMGMSQGQGMNQAGFQFPFMPMFNTGAPQRKTIDEMAEEVGLDYSRDYADQQAEAIKQARQDGLENSMENTQRNLWNAADDMDRNYFVRMLDEQQNQVNSGLNAGIASDRNLRMAMSRQNEMGDLYANANHQMNNYTDELNRLEAEKLAQADELYNNRRQQGFNNWLQYTQMDSNQQNAQFDNNMQYWAMLEDIKRDGRNFQRSSYEDDRNFLRNNYQQDRNYALAEGELTGNYVSHEARGLYDKVLQLRQQADEAGSESIRNGYLQQAETYLRQLASMGVDVSGLDPTQDYRSAMYSISSANPTMAKQESQYAQALDRAQVTGNWIDPQADSLIQQILNIKRNYEAEGRKATPEEVQRADALRAQLSSMGIDTNQIAAPTQTYREALANLSNLPQNTQSQNAQNYAQQLDRAKVTGNFVDPRANELIQSILDIKRSYEESGRKPTRQEIQDADSMRAELSSMGVDTSKVVAADQTYREALNSVNNMPQMTNERYMFDREMYEQGRQFDSSMAWDKSKFGQELAWDQSRFGQELAWDKDRFGQELSWDKNRFGQEMAENRRQFDSSLAFDYKNLETDKQLKKEAMELDKYLGNLDYSIAELDADIRNAEIIQRQLEADGVFESEQKQQQRQANTSAVIGQLAGLSREEAIKELGENGVTWANEGVDIAQVMAALGLTDIMQAGRSGSSGSGWSGKE